MLAYHRRPTTLRTHPRSAPPRPAPEQHQLIPEGVSLRSHKHSENSCPAPFNTPISECAGRAPKWVAGQRNVQLDEYMLHRRDEPRQGKERRQGSNRISRNAEQQHKINRTYVSNKNQRCMGPQTLLAASEVQLWSGPIAPDGPQIRKQKEKAFAATPLPTPAVHT